MSFKGLRSILALLVVGLSCASCGLKLGEKPPETETLVYSGKGYKCVAQIPAHLGDYMNDRMSNEQISEFMRCLENSFTTFAQLTRGRDVATYAPDEIRRFLEQYFIKNRQISDELMHQFMVAKQVLVGGSIDRLSRAELIQAISILDDVRVEAIRIKPHLRFLNPELVVQQDPRDLGRNVYLANEALSQSIRNLSSRLQKIQQPYALKDLASLLNESRKFVHWDEHFPDSHKVQDWMNFLSAFKSISVSPLHPEIIQTTEWVPLLQSLSGWYLAFLRYKIGVAGQPVLEGIGLQNTIYLGHQVFDLIDDAIKSQPFQSDKIITYEQFNLLLTALHELKWIPQNIRVSSMDQFARALITRILGDSDKGLSQVGLSSLRREFYLWSSVQLNLSGQLNGGANLERSVPNLESGSAPEDRPSPLVPRVGNSDWDQFLQIKLKSRPLYSENLGRILLVPQDQLASYGVTHGFYDLSMMNLLRSITAQVFRGYAKNSGSRDLWSWSIKNTELQAFYEDAKNLGMDLGLIDRDLVRNKKSGDHGFTEAKLFTYASTPFVLDATDATGQASVLEIMEYLAFLYSGGKAKGEFYRQLPPECRNGPVDINGFKKMDRACLLEQMPKLFATNLNNMPGLQDYLRKLSPSALKHYMKVTLDTVSDPLANPDWIESNDLGTMIVVVHFAEAVMTRFDTDEDGVLNNAELDAAVVEDLDGVNKSAAELFRGFIKKIAREKLNSNLWNNEATGAFYYILEYKQLPKKQNIAQLWLNPIFEPTIALDRLELAEVFSAIIGNLLVKSVPPPPIPRGALN